MVVAKAQLRLRLRKLTSLWLLRKVDKSLVAAEKVDKSLVAAEKVDKYWSAAEKVDKSLSAAEKVDKCLSAAEKVDTPRTKQKRRRLLELPKVFDFLGHVPGKLPAKAAADATPKVDPSDF